MRSFTDEAGRIWIADVREEDSPRHHTRFYLVFRDEAGSAEYPMQEARWQNRRTAARTIATMSEFELRRRLLNAVGRTDPDLAALRERGADAGRRAETLRGAHHA